MIFGKGFVFRWGQRINDAGERMGHVKVFGIRVFGWLCGPVITLGHRIMGRVLESSTIGELGR